MGFTPAPGGPDQPWPQCKATVQDWVMRVIAVGQFSPGEDSDANLAAIDALVAGAAGRQAAMVVLPEYAMYTPPELDQRIVEHAQPLDGPFVTAIGELARRHGVAIVVGMNELLAGSPRVRNTVVAVGSDGIVRATYPKAHLYDAHGVRESQWIEPGPPVGGATFDVDGIRVGVQTCYDLRFPETTRLLCDAGADVVVVPAQWIPGPNKVDHWQTLLRARAIENTAYVVGAGQCAPTGTGHSMVVDPLGVVVAQLGDDTGVLTAPIDGDLIAAVRAANPVLTARRFDVVPRQ